MSVVTRRLRLERNLSPGNEGIGGKPGGPVNMVDASSSSQTACIYFLSQKMVPYLWSDRRTKLNDIRWEQISVNHMVKLVVTLFAIVLLTAIGSAHGQVSMTYSSAGTDFFSMAIPDNWMVNVGSEKDISRNSADRSELTRIISVMPDSGVPLWFGMWVPEDLETIADTKEYMESLGLDLLSDVVISEVNDSTLNSMDVQYITGTGNRAGEAMDFKAGFFQLSQDRVAIAIYIGPPEATLSYREDLTRMIQSLQPLIQ